MASRKEQKEQLRREREQREAAAKASHGRQRMIGYAVAGAVVLVVAVIAIVGLSGGGGDEASADVLPDGGSLPEIREVDLKPAAKAAGCELKSARATGREHVADLAETIRYATKPPTSGNHFVEWAEDGAYEDPPDIKETVHALEHGRIVIWFKKGLPSEQRAALKAYFDEDSYQILLVPDTSGMKYEVAASSWTREPTPNGTGHLLGCTKFSDEFFTALEAFKDEYRSRGPEAVP